MAFLSTRVKLISRSLNSLLLYSNSHQNGSKYIRHYSDQDSDDTNKSAKKESSAKYSTIRSKDGEITSGWTLLQDGLVIQEVPVLIKSTCEIPGITDNKDITVDVEPQATGNKHNEALNTVIKLHLRQVTNVAEVLQYLLVIPSKDVTPLVALSILERIIELQNDATDEGDVRKTPLTESNIICMLCDVICRSSSSNILLSGLETVIKIRLHFPESEKKSYVEIFVKECMQRIHSGKLSLMEICRLIENLFNAGRDFQAVSDNVWSEIVCRQHEINIENVNRVFALLLYLKCSRNIVLSMLEKQILKLYPNLQQKQIIHMLHILCLLKLHSVKLFSIFSAWTRLNIHRVTEPGLRDVIMLMNSIQYTDETIETAVERFIKVRGTKCKDILLVTALSDKLRMFNWRNTVLLESISNFFIQNVNHLSSETFSGLVQLFGYLNYEPANAFKLYEVLENVLPQKIPEFEPDSVICILLSCVYVQRYPLNFVKKVFSPGFLDRLNFQAANDETRRRKAYNNLRLLDTALHLECPTYSGPYLPKKLTPRNLLKDSRRFRLKTAMRDLLSQLLGSPDFFEESVVLPKLPLDDLYIVDYMIHVDKNGKPLPYSAIGGIQTRVAVLLLLPEYYCNCSNTTADVLIGPQAMRLRHLKLIGLTVVPLKFATLEKLCGSHKELVEYVQDNLIHSVSTLHA